MPSSVIRLEDAADVLEAIDHEIAKHAVLAMRSAAVTAKARAVRAIGETKPHVPVDLSEMIRSYMVIPLPNGARLENVAPHAAIQEYGTKPFAAPFDPLLAWAKRKSRGGMAKAEGPKLAPRLGPKRPPRLGPKLAKREGPRMKRNKAYRDRVAVRQFARMAWNSIFRYGVKPKGFHARASQDFADITSKAMSAAMRKVRG